MIVAVTGLLCLAPLVAAQELAPTEKTGLKIGAKAPPLKLKDQTGKQLAFADLVKNADFVALVFHRSANW